MKRFIKLFAITFAGLLITFVACSDENIIQNSNTPPNDQVPEPGAAFSSNADKVKQAENRYIVVFKGQSAAIADEQAAQIAVDKTNAVLSSAGIPADSVIHQYKWASQGFAGRFTADQVEKLRKDPRVDHVVKDYYYQAIQTAPVKAYTFNAFMQVGQATPWGVARVRGPLDGTGTTAWILDTGIDLDHPDLNVDNGNSASFVAAEPADDLHGHGSHVAGIVGALDNARDVVGVAAGATMVAVKVCDQAGGCFVSDVKAGVDYVAGNYSSGDVANLSLGWPTDGSDPNVDIPLSDLENSIINAANSGLKFTIAAGNEAQDSNNKSPARINHSNVWTVSAFREGDEFVQTFDWNTPNCNELEDFDVGSNFKSPPVDYSGPGESIFSLWENGQTLITCGTSMAAPHIAGLLLASADGIITDGAVSNDPDGDPDPIAIADLPISVTVSGPSLLNAGQTGYFSALVSDDDGSVSYQWYYRNSPGDSWKADGTGPNYQHTWYQEETQAAVKVDVSSNGESDSDVHDVYITCSSSTTTGSAEPQVPDPC